MADITAAFGLDFGTSKSAVTWARADSANPNVIDVMIDGQSDRIDTCVLADKEKGRIFIGTKAHEQHRLCQLNGGAEGLEFFANFKPHISESAADREAALRFLKEIRRSEGLLREFEQVPPAESIFIVGCPAAWIADGAAALIELLLEADFPPAFAIPEPVGAAFYFLGSKLRAQAFHRDIVVCDWGAGTFDMTVLRSGRLDIEAGGSFGSKLYGGRLFDDLFYQWVLEAAQRNRRGADVRRLAGLPVEQEVFHALHARRIKEDFSRFCARHERPQSWIWEAPVIVGVGPNRIDLGDFVVSRVAEFEDRMRNYTPSNLARRWIDLASRGPEGDDADYVEALKSGKSVDLFAWGAALFERGLRTLAVGEEATIILTGGSSNWRWFSDHVSSKWPFAGRPSSVIFDSKPELTIARGLARVYAIGSYSGRLAGEIRAARKELMRPLRAIHRDILQKLAARLAIMIQSNEKLRGDLETILRSWAVKGFEPTASPGPAERLKHYFLSAAGNRFAEEIRLLIERCLKDWLVENQQEIRAASESFSQEAYRRVMALLRSRIRSEIGGLVEVAVEACGASGGARLDEALRGLGHNVKFEPNLALKLYGALAKVVSDAYSALMREEQPAIRGAFAAKDGDLVAAQTAKAMERLHLSLPGAIERNILAIQSSEAWSNQVIDHLLMTLRTLERLARGEHARSLVTQERRQ